MRHTYQTKAGVRSKPRISRGGGLTKRRITSGVFNGGANTRQMTRSHSGLLLRSCGSPPLSSPIPPNPRSFYFAISTPHLEMYGFVEWRRPSGGRDQRPFSFPLIPVTRHPTTKNPDLSGLSYCIAVLLTPPPAPSAAILLAVSAPARPSRLFPLGNRCFSPIPAPRHRPTSPA